MCKTFILDSKVAEKQAKQKFSKKDFVSPSMYVSVQAQCIQAFNNIQIQRNPTGIGGFGVPILVKTWRQSGEVDQVIQLLDGGGMLKCDNINCL